MINKRFEAALACITKIEDYFEYSYKSELDRKYVLMVIEQFTEEMEKLNDSSTKRALGRRFTT